MAASSAREISVARLHFIVCCGLLLVGLGHVAYRGATLGAVVAAFPWTVMAAYSILIIGTSRMLLAGVLGLRLAGGGRLALVPGGMVLLGSFAFASSQAPWWLAGLWGAGLLLHALIVAATFLGRRRAASLPIAGRTPGLGGAVMVAALVYALAASVVAPMAKLGLLSLSILVHLALTGFVVGTIVGVSFLLLPRFTGRRIPRSIMVLVGALCLLGPSLLAAGLHGSERLLRMGAVVEAAGLGSFAILVLVLLVMARRRRASFAAYAGASVSILVGLCLGVLFAFDPTTRSWVPVHGVLNLFGFTGLFVVGASTDLYGPSLRGDPGWFRAQSWITTMLALVATLLLGLGAAYGGARWGAWPYMAAIGLHALGGIRGLWTDLGRGPEPGPPTVAGTGGPAGPGA